MKQEFPNRSCFRYCLLQHPWLLARMAAGALGVSCDQGSWQQWWLYQPYTSAHPTSSSPASHQPSPSIKMPATSFVIFTWPYCLVFSLLFLLSHFQDLVGTGSVLARADFGGGGCGTACVQIVPASQLNTFLHNTEQFECQQRYVSC